MKHLKKIGNYHKLAGLAPPQHPLVSLIDYATINYGGAIEELVWRQEYYTIALKRNIPYKLFYGQQEYDFDEGVMTFVAPNQIMRLAQNPNLKSAEPTGWLLLIHPDFLWNSPLGKAIARYEFFGYGVKEALFLSEKEERMMVGLLEHIRNEYTSHIDVYSQKIILSQIELLLNYAERFYGRQFITRKISNHGVLGRVEELLSHYFNTETLVEKGLPSVQWVADQLHLSPNYLSSSLKAVSGQGTQQHIHDKLIEKAKEELSSGHFSVSEVAYHLGFEHPASFSKLFKKKTEMTPLEFSRQYN